MALSDAKPSAVAAWTLDESSGTRADSVGSIDLTDNNTVAATTGQFSNAADFERDNSEYLSHSNVNGVGDAVEADSVVTLTFWINYESLESGAFDNVIFSVPIHGGAAGLWVNLRGDAGHVGKVRAGGRSQGADLFQTVTSTGALSQGATHLVAVVIDFANDEVTIGIDGTFDSAQSVTFAATAYTNGSPSFAENMGRSFSGSSHYDGWLDDFVMLGDYELSSTEFTELWNSGNGVAFADWAASAAAADNIYYRSEYLVNALRPHFVIHHYKEHEDPLSRIL